MSWKSRWAAAADATGRVTSTSPAAAPARASSSALAMTNAIKMSGTFVRKGTNSRLAETILANEELTRFSRAI